MAGGGDVGDGHGKAVVEGVEDLAHQDAGIERDGLAGLQIDLDPVAFVDLAQEGGQGLDVVIRAGDVVAAAEVEPLL